jgi:hypothetical protein
METEAYCDRLDGQLVAWKAKIYDAIRIVDRLPAAEKEMAFSSIRNLHAIVDEIDGQLDQLRHACPADWSPNRRTIDQKMSDLHGTLKKLSKKIKGPIIPDSLAWVSD